MSRAFWDSRYAEPGWTYGDAPNDFLREVAPRIPRGPILSLGEGQGRNAVYLASLGYAVTAVDQSGVGLERARALASARGVEIQTCVADLTEYDPGPGPWNAILSIFCHVPPAVRKRLYPRCADILAPGGLLILESYTPGQLACGTGGPKDPELLCTLEELRALLPQLEFEVGQERIRDIREGAYHQGPGAVVQVLARKPA